jgi:hypothetical protein
MGSGTRIELDRLNLKKRCWAFAMRHAETKRQDDPNKREESTCRILPFRPPARDAARDIEQLIDLSRYEKPLRYTNDYGRRMMENVAAIVLLTVLVAFAAFDVIGLEQVQHCAWAGSC